MNRLPQNERSPEESKSDKPSGDDIKQKCDTGLEFYDTELKDTIETKLAALEDPWDKLSLVTGILGGLMLHVVNHKHMNDIDMAKTMLMGANSIFKKRGIKL